MFRGSSAEAEIKISEENLMKLTAYANFEIKRNMMGDYFMVKRYVDGNKTEVIIEYEVPDYEKYKRITSCLPFFADEIVWFTGYHKNPENSDTNKIVWKGGAFLEYGVNIDETIKIANFEDLSIYLGEYKDLKVFSRLTQIGNRYIKEALNLSNNFEAFFGNVESLSQVSLELNGNRILEILGNEETELYSKDIKVLLYTNSDGVDIAYIESINKQYTLLTDSEFENLKWKDRICSENETKKLRIRYKLVKGRGTGELIIPYEHAITLFNSFEYNIKIKHENEWTSPCNLCVNRLKKLVAECKRCVFTPIINIEAAD